MRDRALLIALIVCGCLISGGLTCQPRLVAPDEKWALIVGIGQYEDRLIGQTSGSIDAKTLANLLIREAGFKREHVVLLTAGAGTDHEPTRANILYALDRLGAPAGALIVFGFFGHGLQAGSSPVLLPKEFSSQRPGSTVVSEIGLRLELISRLIKEKTPAETIFFVDACRELETETTKLQAGWASSGLGRAPQTNRAALFATSAGHPSFDAKTGNPGFFMAAIKSIFDDSAKKDQDLTMGELAQRLQADLPVTTRREVHEAQYPEVRFEGRSADLVIADRMTRKAVPPIPVAVSFGPSDSPLYPHPLEDGLRVYLADETRRVIQVTSTEATRESVDVRPRYPHSLIFVPGPAGKDGGSRLYVLDARAEKIFVLDGANLGNVLSEDFVKLPGRVPKAFAITPDRRKLYVANEKPLGRATVTVVSLSDGHVIKEIPGFNCAEGLALSEDGARLYVATQCGMEEDPVFVVDTETDLVVNTIRGLAVGLGITVAGSPPKIYVARGGFLSRDPVTGQVVNRPGQLTVLNAESGAVVANLPIDVQNLYVSQDRKYVFASAGSRLAVIDTRTDEIVKKMTFQTTVGGVVADSAVNGNLAGYVWLPEEERLFFTGLNGILNPR